MAFSVTLAGQDITQYVDQMSIDIVDALGQGSGAGSSNMPQGRAGTIQFDTSLGPANTAIGAGQSIPPPDQSILFDGSSGHVTLLSSLKVDGYTALSIIAWINLTSNTYVTYPRILTNNDTPGTSHNGFLLELAPSSDGSGGYFIIGNGTTSAQARFQPGGGVLSKNSWHMLAAVYDGTELVTYLDGVQQEVSPLISGGIGTASSPLIVGASVALTNLFPGMMSELTVLSSALTYSQVRQVWNAQSGYEVTYRNLINSLNPVAYYHMDESAFSTLIDYSGHSNNGTMSATGLSLKQPDFLKSPPWLVRQGEIVIKNATGQTIWGGYLTKLTDITSANGGKSVNLGNTKQNFTTVNGVDYEGALSRVMVNVSYVGQTDVQIIKQILSQYAPWVGQSLLPATGTFVFPVENFRQVSVLQVIQTIAGITGYLVWLDFAKNIHYVSPSVASTASFKLSDSPDFMTSFPHNVQSFVIDDNSAINRVTFYGGQQNSGNFFQDVSPLANGNNKVFSLAYYPSPTSDGLFHATVNGVQQAVGYATGSSTPGNTFKSQGGTADALIDTSAQNITFDVAPPIGATVIVEYQYQFPLTVVVTDETSHQFFGNPYLDSYISDTSVFSTTIAVQRAKVVLTQQSFGLVSLQLNCWQGGLQSGQLVHITNVIRGINATYLIQEVETLPLGAGNFVYQLTLGAWNWNLVDVIVKLAHGQALQDQQQAENVVTLVVEQSQAKVSVSTAWVLAHQTVGPYYARSTPVGDGHDAYPGFATISS